MELNSGHKVLSAETMSSNNTQSRVTSDAMDISQNGHGNDETLARGSASAKVDITSRLQDAAGALTFASPMIHTEAFNLQDSMAALEIMDKKMDCCEISEQTLKMGKVTTTTTTTTEMLLNERMIFPRPPPAGLDDEVNPLPWNKLTMEDSAFIALENLIRLESLLSGSSVVESIYTSLYAHKLVLEDMRKRLEPSISLVEQMKNSSESPCRPGITPQYIVFASTLMLVELTDLIRGIILNADIYEEEDFAVTTFNIPSFQRSEDGYTIKVGHVVLRLIEQELSNTENHYHQEPLEAIGLVMGFQLDFVASISALARLSGKNIQAEVERAQKLARRAKKKLEDLSLLFPKLTDQKSDSVTLVIRKTFDAFVNRPLVGNAPVRMIDFLDATEAITVLIKTVHELDWAVCNVMLKGESLGRIQRMMRPVSPSCANILNRSLMVLNLYFDDKIFGLYPLPDLVVGNILQLSHIPDNILKLSATQAFLNRLCKPIYDTLKLMVLNRNRQRSYLDIMLGDWAALREEAYVADVTNHQESGSKSEVHPHFTLYVLSKTIEIMDEYVDVGVELELFTTEHDLTVAYWYRDFLTSSLLTQLNAMRRYKLEVTQTPVSDQHMPSSTKSQKGGKRKGKNKKGATNGSINNNNNNNRGKQTNVPTAKDVEEEVEYLLWNAKRYLCRGLVRFFSALDKAGLIKHLTYEFTTNENIFQKRFEPFVGIHQPPLLSYHDFELGSDASKLRQEDIVAASSESFSVSKSMLDKALVHMEKLDPDYLAMPVEEIRQLSKVCVGNSIYLQRLLQVSKGNGNPKASVMIDTKTHKQYCTIKII
jgi:hypothetical protein